MVQADRYATSSERLNKDRELVTAASLSTVVFGVLLTALMAVAAWLTHRVETAEPDRQMVVARGLLLIAGILFIGLGLGVWYRQQWCAVATIILLIGLMAAHVLMAGGAVGSVFFLVVPLIPVITNWIALPAFRRLAETQAPDS
ncbi:MAG TPA: hypothetical protein VMZ31_02970 [Phycisphaerae bacterium]|nr:hypothetical protein [Phycisphaerae bacterium]